jgi:hypothetical protein
MSTLLNKRQVKAFTLEVAKSRAHKSTRIGSAFYTKCEAHLRTFIRGYVQRLPSRGKTIL